MNTRIASIRKENNLSQQEFANRLGLTKNFISLLETGNREPSDRTISDICREFKVNEEWLIHGTGDKNINLSREEAVAELAEKILKNKPGSFVERAAMALAKADEEQLEAVERFLDMFYEKKE